VLDDALNTRIYRHQDNDIQQRRMIGDDQTTSASGEADAVLEFRREYPQKPKQPDKSGECPADEESSPIRALGA
jgi:hypothetical protein